MREPSLDAKYFCSSTKRICEFTKLTPLTAIAVSLSFMRNAILVSSGTSNGSRLIGLFHVVVDAVGVGQHHLAGGEHRVGAGDGHGLFRDQPSRRGLDPVRGGKAPGAIHQHAEAHAIAGRALSRSAPAARAWRSTRGDSG